MELNESHQKFKDSFGIEPGRLLQVLSEQKTLLLNEFNRLHKAGIIDDATMDTISKKGSAITVKYFPEFFTQFQQEQDESQNTES